MTYNALALSAINSLNYLFLRYTFKGTNGEQEEVILDELTNFVCNFERLDLQSDKELKEILTTELIEGDYCEGLTKTETRDLYALSLYKLMGSHNELVDYYVSLLPDDYYHPTGESNKDYDHITDRDGKELHPGMVILFDVSISNEPEFYSIKQIGHELFIHKSDNEPFVNLIDVAKVFRAVRATDNPDYIEGYGCPRCFSDDTTTLVASRENTCNKCGLHFPLPEEEAKSMEDENTKYALAQLTIDAQVKAYVDYLNFSANIGEPGDETFSGYLEMADHEGFTYDAAGNFI